MAKLEARTQRGVDTVCLGNEGDINEERGEMM